jgi:predicted RNase H-like HicB family nuclease
MKMKNKFLVVIEKAGRNYSAYSPDLPGCVATGRTQKEAEANMHAAVEMHVQGLLDDRLPVPVTHSSAAYVLLAPQARTKTSSSSTHKRGARR